jgi:hypothetical protein
MGVHEDVLNRDCDAKPTRASPLPTRPGQFPTRAAQFPTPRVISRPAGCQQRFRPAKSPTRSSRFLCLQRSRPAFCRPAAGCRLAPDPQKFPLVHRPATRVILRPAVLRNDFQTLCHICIRYFFRPATQTTNDRDGRPLRTRTYSCRTVLYRNRGGNSNNCGAVKFCICFYSKVRIRRLVVIARNEMEKHVGYLYVAQ